MIKKLMVYDCKDFLELMPPPLTKREVCRHAIKIPFQNSPIFTSIFIDEDFSNLIL